MPKDLPVAESDIATIAPAATEVNALALPTLNPEAYAAAVYEPFGSKLKAAIDSVQTIDYDIKTTAGMAVAVKARATFRDLRIDADKEREARKAPILKIGKLLQSGYVGIEERAKPLELMFDADIEAEVARKAEVKAEAERVEAERIAAIRAKIAEITGLLVANAAATSDELTAALQVLAKREIEKAEFAELTDEARTAVEYVAVELMALRNAAKVREQAEANRLAELAAEKKRNEEQAEANRLAAIENERVANAQAAERQRLADLAAAQEAEAARIRKQAGANLKDEQEALAEQVRLQREAAAEQQAKLDAQQAAIEAQRAAFVREQEEARQRAEDAAKMEAKHAEALIDNATFDDAMTRLAAADTPTFHVAPSDDRARCNATVANLLSDARTQPAFSDTQIRDSLIAYAESHPDDAEVTDKEIMAIAAELGLTPDAWVERLTAFCERMNSVTATGQRYSRTTFKDNGAAIFLNEDGSRSIFCDLDD